MTGGNILLLEHKIYAADSGKSVKQIIEHTFSLSSRTLSKLKKSGGIKVNGETVTVRHIVKEADTLSLLIEDKPSENIEKTDIPLDILYEDKHILAVNKPLGMPTHPSQGHHSDTLANAVMYRYRNLDFTFRAITRLDGDTTGVVLIARNSLSAQRLTDALQNGDIKKEYAAVVLGVPSPEKGIINAPIARCEDSIIKRRISPEGKTAVTEYEADTVRHDKKYTLVKAFPVTGRTHQIRLHLSHIGSPIYGDFLYGEPIEGVRAYLHCRRLSLSHPITGKALVIEAPLPDDIKEIMHI